MAHTHYVANLLAALLLRGERNHSRIGKENQLRITRNLRSCHVRQHTTFRQNTVLFIQHGAEQNIRIDQAFHQQVYLTFARQSHSLFCSVLLVSGINYGEMIV